MKKHAHAQLSKEIFAPQQPDPMKLPADNMSAAKVQNYKLVCAG